MIRWLYPHSTLAHRIEGSSRGEPGLWGLLGHQMERSEQNCRRCGGFEFCGDCGVCGACVPPPAWRGREEHPRLPRSFRSRVLSWLMVAEVCGWQTDFAELVVASLAVVSGSCSPCPGPAWCRTRSVGDAPRADWLGARKRSLGEKTTKTSIELKVKH
jgi:hypothetical protein